MFQLHYKIIHTTPCNNTTYRGNLSKSNIKRSNKNLWLNRNTEHDENKEK